MAVALRRKKCKFLVSGCQGLATRCISALETVFIASEDDNFVTFDLAWGEKFG